MSVVIKTAESEVKTSAKNNKNYKVITLKEAGLISTPWGMMPLPDSQAKETKIVSWEENINGKMDIGYSEPIFNKLNPQAGGYFRGALATRATAPYIVPSTEAGKPDRTVESGTVIVFANPSEPGYEVHVKKAFKAKGLSLVNAPGVETFEHADPTQGHA